VQVAGNRFARGLSDIPAGMKGDYPHDPEALIDILVPADTSRSRENVRVGDDLFTTEVPGLDLAIARPPVTIALDLHRLNGQTLRCDLPFADELSALVLKGLATRVRFKDTDVADVWRCLEIALAAGLGPEDFARGARKVSAEVIRGLFSSRHGTPMAALAAAQRPFSQSRRQALYADTSADRTCTRTDLNAAVSGGGAASSGRRARQLELGILSGIANGQSIKCWLIDRARRSGQGSLRRRLEAVLGGDDAYARIAAAMMTFGLG